MYNVRHLDHLKALTAFAFGASLSLPSESQVLTLVSMHEGMTVIFRSPQSQSSSSELHDLLGPLYGTMRMRTYDAIHCVSSNIIASHYPSQASATRAKETASALVTSFSFPIICQTLFRVRVPLLLRFSRALREAVRETRCSPAGWCTPTQ